MDPAPDITWDRVRVTVTQGLRRAGELSIGELATGALAVTTIQWLIISMGIAVYVLDLSIFVARLRPDVFGMGLYYVVTTALTQTLIGSVLIGVARNYKGLETDPQVLAKQMLCVTVLLAPWSESCGLFAAGVAVFGLFRPDLAGPLDRDGSVAPIEMDAVRQQVMTQLRRLEPLLDEVRGFVQGEPSQISAETIRARVPPRTAGLLTLLVLMLCLLGYQVFSGQSPRYCARTYELGVRMLREHRTPLEVVKIHGILRELQDPRATCPDLYRQLQRMDG